MYKTIKHTPQKRALGIRRLNNPELGAAEKGIKNNVLSYRKDSGSEGGIARNIGVLKDLENTHGPLVQKGLNTPGPININQVWRSLYADNACKNECTAGLERER